MNTKYIAFMALVTGTLVGTVAIATDSAFATENNQVISQDCGQRIGIIEYWMSKHRFTD